MEYGFVYIWRDRKHKRYYIGCHWGHVDDGYVCSSTWMKQAYNIRPQDFKRRIISLIFTNKKDMFDEEFHWLSKIQNSDLGKKYYNIYNFPRKHWSADEAMRLKVIAQFKNKPGWYKGKHFSEEHKKRISDSKKGKKLSEETKKKLRDCNVGKKLSEETKDKMRRRRHSQETKDKMSKAHKGNTNMLGKRHSEEAKKKISQAAKEQHLKARILKQTNIDHQ